MMEEKKDDSQKENVKKKRFSQGLPVFNPYAAGIDIGDKSNFVAISDGANGFEVREFKTFTEDLKDNVNWLKSEGIITVAMESTGIYWLPLYLMLEEAGIEPYLVNARHVKNVTGRKKDDSDAIWLQKLHSCGLLQKSFQPEAELRTLRNYVRQRRNLVSISSDSVRRMHTLSKKYRLNILDRVMIIYAYPGKNHAAIYVFDNDEQSMTFDQTRELIQSFVTDVLENEFPG